MDTGRAGHGSSLLVLGGARSGKSAFAQAQAEASRFEPIFIATAQAFDAEMEVRIAAHARARGSRWRLIEAPLDLTAALTSASDPARVLVVDCLTLWLTNVMLGGDDVDAATDALVDVVARLEGPVIFVSNEVGSGIVPENALSRRFRDAQGRLNQAMARACDGVVLVTAGLPFILKPGVPAKVWF
ncbi:MAG: bifunctional adenosylcobinamide kinase/adenosylcobinamide-phosphate guanylyltransferase [Beijerinckiaceae bacterium]|nr:bifunctional adenosylcobinamide kinase/adenosylcobinamide-phosphate guanylyltransferase [Beijerinckiaceae bacterium]